MQKRSLGLATLTSFLVIVFLIQPLNQFVAVEANPFCTPTIFIESPTARDIYQTTSIPIKVYVDVWETGIKFTDIFYILDGGPNVKLNVTRRETSTTITGIGTLENLTDGYHTVIALSTDTKGNVLSDSIAFLVNTTIRFPTILLSPNNTTYYNKEIPLTYTINDSKYVVSYRLDDSSRPTTLTGNTTLTGISEGHHTITLKASSTNNGIYSIYSKQTANFTIDTINPSPTPTTTEFSSWAIPLLLTIMVTLAGLVVCFKKQKQGRLAGFA